MFVGKQIWDPWAICWQILVLQAIFYVGLVFAYLTLVVSFAPGSGMGMIFRASAIDIHSFGAIMLCLAYLFNACISAVALRFIVARTKKCWDFGATIYILHTVLTTVCDGFPSKVVWWVLIGVCMVTTILLGEFLCARFELADIPLGLGEKRKVKQAEKDLEAQVPLATLSDT